MKNILVTAEGPGDQTIRYSDPKTGKRLDYPVYNEDGSLFSVEQPPVSYTGSAVLRLFGPDKDHTFTVSKDVSYALMPDAGSIYDIQTKASSASATDYTTTITIKDDGYENVYAFGDWVAVDKDGKLHGPDEWANGMDYATSSALPLTKSAGGDWELKVDLASSVMGVICYHDVADAKDLENVKPLKTSLSTSISDVAVVFIHTFSHDPNAQPEAKDEVFQRRDAVDFVL